MTIIVLQQKSLVPYYEWAATKSLAHLIQRPHKIAFCGRAVVEVSCDVKTKRKLCNACLQAQQDFLSHMNQKHLPLAVMVAKLPFSKDQARNQIANAEMKLVRCRNYFGGAKLFRPVIRISGRWHNLCRTDLYDDVGTYTTKASGGQIDPWERNFWWDKARYGARYSHRGGNRRPAFSVVDSMTDG